MKIKHLFLLIFPILAVALVACNKKEDITTSTEYVTQVQEKEESTSLINGEGMTIESRVLTPEGFTRGEAKEGSFTAFLRGYAVKEAEAPVLLYDKREKGNQSAHVAVLKLPLEQEDLQQCADSVMRVYAEYFYSEKKYDQIAFHFTNGFLAEYTKWQQGYRIAVNGNQVIWVKQKGYDDSYETFQSYLRMVFSYAGTLSMEQEARAITLKELRVGDVFLHGGSPGHVVMVLDICENERGEKAFLLGQGYMPAQEFHILKNPMHEEDPWYYETELSYPLTTPEYTFEEGSLKRLSYLK